MSETTQAIRFVPQDFKRIEKNTLVGSFTIRVEPVGLLIRECLFHRKGDREWIAFPAKSYSGKDGKPVYTNVLDWPSRDVWDKFQAVMVPRVRQLMGSEAR